MDPQTPQTPQVSNEQSAPATDVVGQVIGAIQNGKNVLVTVGTDPTVDELASALGLTFLLGKLDKHATAVFSGNIPPAMEFLDPEKTFENTVDSLRDFIIALDKEKADKLRYKVEDDVVKIFITPYKTVLSEKDLEFSQGDFNVDVVIALGVEKREELDKAIIAHGRILHDATVITINAGNKTSGLGSIDWSEPAASSTAEMLVSLSDAFGGDLLDNQISTAFLTGIVAETNRFSNDKTSPKVMNLSAQLMAAGANQQLIATNLRQEGMISEPVRKKEANQPHDDNGEMVLDHGEAVAASETPKKEEKSSSEKPKTGSKTAKQKKVAAPEPPKQEESVAGSTRQLKETLDKAAAAPAPEEEVDDDAKEPPEDIDDEPKSDDGGVSTEPAEESPLPPLEPIKPEPAGTKKVIEPLPAAPTPPPITPLSSPHTPTDKPAFGGTLNATTAIAEEENAAQEAREAAAHNVALTHEADGAALEEARKAVEDANEAQPFTPENQPLQAINSEPLPSVEPVSAPDTSVAALQSVPPTPSAAPASSDEAQSPVDAFVQPHTENTNSAAPSLNAPTPSSAPLPPLPTDQSAAGSLPPLPPLPGSDASGPAAGLPPLPPLPGQSDQPTNMTGAQPQINPAFMQNLPQSQNPWTQAGDDLAAQQADSEAARQQKADKMTQQYDQAVDRNRELQGLPPVNNPNGSGLPPLPPV